MINAMNNAVSAMDAFATGVQGNAYNIANVNTNGFDPVSVRYQSGPAAGENPRLEQGVQAIVTRPGSDGLAGSNAAQSDTVSFSPEAMALANPSNTDIAREMTGLIANQRAFEANAATIPTQDQMLGTIINIKS